MVNFGRRLQHDPQSLEHAFTGAAPSPVHVRHAMKAQHVDQFYTSGCVGFGGTNWLNTTKATRNRLNFNSTVHKHKAINYLGNNDGIENYHEATIYDPFPGQYPPTDDGSSAIGLMKWWKKVGIITQYQWTFTFDAFLAALAKQPVLIGTNWYDDMMSTGPDGVVKSSASGNGGGHEYCATEIIPAGMTIRRVGLPSLVGPLIGYEQSWGAKPPGFGIGGRFWMSHNLAEELIIGQQGDVAVPELL
jgi:hypothetical protein